MQHWLLGPKTTKAPDLVILDNGTLLEGKYFKRFRNSIKYTKLKI